MKVYCFYTGKYSLGGLPLIEMCESQAEAVRKGREAGATEYCEMEITFENESNPSHTKWSPKITKQIDAPPEA